MIPEGVVQDVLQLFQRDSLHVELGRQRTGREGGCENRGANSAGVLSACPKAPLGNEFLRLPDENFATLLSTEHIRGLIGGTANET